MVVVNERAAEEKWKRQAIDAEGGGARVSGEEKTKSVALPFATHGL